MTNGPRFIEPIPNVTVALGRDASLPCVVENLGSYKVSHCVIRTLSVVRSARLCDITVPLRFQCVVRELVTSKIVHSFVLITMSVKKTCRTLVTNCLLRYKGRACNMCSYYGTHLSLSDVFEHFNNCSRTQKVTLI
jgi:hypothetical protein